jgi:serine/threonine-protein kinase
MEDDLQRRALERLGATLRDKYRLERLLGVGGMAAVYTAEHRNGRRVAVKMLHAELSLNREVRERFLREGQAANRVGHAGAVAVLDDDVPDEGVAFLVMELLDGDSLENLSQKGALAEPVVYAVALELLAVLDAAHKNGIVHRDIKPANLFVTTNGQLKVLDFGIARVTSSSASATQTGMALGTPAFMAPEQALGRTQQIDARTDLWAVGATLFALRSGQTVHTAETAQETLIRAATTPAPSLASVCPDASPRLVALVDRAIAFDAAQRWPSAAAMREAIASTGYAESSVAADLLALLEGRDAALSSARPVLSRPAERQTDWASVTGTPAAPARSRRRPALLAGIGALAVVGGAAAWQLRAPSVTPREAPSSASTSAVVVPAAASVSPVVATAAAASVSAPPAAPKRAPRAAEPARLVASIAAAPAASSAPVAPPHPKATLNCNPPYTLDADGTKRWKRACL